MANVIQSIEWVLACIAQPSEAGNDICSLSVGFNEGSNIRVFEVYVNDIEFAPTSGSADWPAIVGATIINGNYISGVTAGKVCNVKTRTFFKDGTQEDSPVTSYTVPSTFVCPTGTVVTAKPKPGKRSSVR